MLTVPIALQQHTLARPWVTLLEQSMGHLQAIPVSGFSTFNHREAQIQCCLTLVYPVISFLPVDTQFLCVMKSTVGKMRYVYVSFVPPFY